MVLSVLANEKLVAVEMLAVFQITFLSLVVVKDMSPTVSALTNLYIANGFNKLIEPDYWEYQSLPNQFKGLYLSPYFL